MTKCAVHDCPTAAEHRLQMVAENGRGITGFISVCSDHVADVERRASEVMAAVQGDRFNTTGHQYRVEPRPDNIVPLRPLDDRDQDVSVMRNAIADAITWHRTHPGSDHLDAAFAVAGHAGDLGHSRWPEFVAAVRESVEEAESGPVALCKDGCSGCDADREAER